MMIESSPLFDVEMEDTILGYLLLNNEAYQLVCPFLRSEHFADEFNRRLFDAIKLEIESGRIASIMTLRPYFMESSGFLLNVSSKANNIILPHHAKDLAQQILSLAVRRQARLALQEAHSELESIQQERTAEEIMAGLVSKIQKISQSPSSDSAKKISAVVGEIVAALDKPLACHKTGISNLDISMGGGMYQGKAYGIAARKKVGKTVICSTISYNLSMRGVPHLFICGEMSSKEVEQRNIARFGGFNPLNFLNTERVTQAMRDHIKRYKETMPDVMVYEDAPGLTFDALKGMVSRALINHKIKGFILDYWQLVLGKDNNRSTAEHLDAVAQWCADFARKHNIFALVAAQINQEGNTRGGEGIKLAFDQVYTLWRENDKQETWMEMTDSRYTEWRDVGSKEAPGMLLQYNGPWFKST